MHFLVVDDDFGSRVGMVQTLGALYPGAHLHQAASIAAAIGHLENTPGMSLVLLDLNLEDSREMDSLVRLKQWCEDHECNPRVVVLSAAADYDEKVIVQAIDYCATGFIAKGTSLDVFKSAVDLTLAGSIFVPDRYLRAKRANTPVETEELRFTPRERQVAALLIQGLTYKQIARKLEAEERGRALSDNTVRVHVQRIAWKLKVADQAQGDGLSAKAAVLTAFADRRLRFA